MSGAPYHQWGPPSLDAAATVTPLPHACFARGNYRSLSQTLVTPLWRNSDRSSEPDRGLDWRAARSPRGWRRRSVAGRTLACWPAAERRTPSAWRWGARRHHSAPSSTEGSPAQRRSSPLRSLLMRRIHSIDTTIRRRSTKCWTQPNPTLHRVPLWLKPTHHGISSTLLSGRIASYKVAKMWRIRVFEIRTTDWPS